MKALELENTKVGNLTVSSKHKSIGGRRHWLCRCECGGEKWVQTHHLTQKRTTNCGCEKNKTGSLNGAWKGYKDLGHRVFGRYERGAKQRNIEFDLTIEDVWRQYEKQRMKCPLSGIDLFLDSKRLNASLDRIDSNRGYVVGNIQWIYRKLNRFKNNYSQEEFISMCKLVAENCV